MTTRLPEIDHWVLILQNSFCARRLLLGSLMEQSSGSRLGIGRRSSSSTPGPFRIPPPGRLTVNVRSGNVSGTAPTAETFRATVASCSTFSLKHTGTRPRALRRSDRVSKSGLRRVIWRPALPGVGRVVSMFRNFCAFGHGFGVPLIEGLACGPVRVARHVPFAR
jgi:hypothetical protein